MRRRAAPVQVIGRSMTSIDLGNLFAPTAISWGDGATTPATVTRGTGPGNYVVSGAHRYAGTGPYTITVHIRDDGGSAATVTTPALIYATGQGGNFTIGTNHAAPGDATTFWGSTWRRVTPSNFRGWEDQLTLPACGATWTTTPYVSGPPPPAPLPAYIPVIVTGGFTQLPGGRVTGTAPHIVVVRTNPGYQPSPSSRGTGRVVATIC
jgi:hypothetical protein